MRFAFVESWRHLWAVELICRVMQVSTRGYRSWRSRPMSERSRTDMKLLAHISKQRAVTTWSLRVEVRAADKWASGRGRIEAVGATLHFLPLYSPDFNPIVKASPASTPPCARQAIGSWIAFRTRSAFWLASSNPENMPIALVHGERNRSNRKPLHCYQYQKLAKLMVQKPGRSCAFWAR